MNLSSVFGPHRPATPEHGRLGDRGIVALLATILVGELALVAAAREPSHWQPVALVFVLTAFTVSGELFAVRVGRVCP